MKNRSLYLIILALVVASLACSQLTVTNQSVLPASVQVSLPDGASHLVYMRAGASQSWFTFEGGAYQVSVVSTEHHIEFMKTLRDGAIAAMLNGESGGMFGLLLGPDADPVDAFNAYVDFGEAIEGERQGVTCSGELPYANLETFEFDLAFGEVDTETVVLDNTELAWTCQN